MSKDVKTEATKVAKPDPEELVEYTAPLSANPEEDRPIFVAVNGESIRIMRGEPVKIKRKFVEVLRHADEQQRAALIARRKAMQTTKIAEM